MTPLYKKLVTLIESEGPISVERYMALCLSDPEHGYYMSRDPFGTKGDFTTAPEISQMFGELIGLWVADYAVRANMVAPLHIVEIGPGRGTLMSDAIRAMRVIPNLVENSRFTMIETSPNLTSIQQQTLAQSGIIAEWKKSIEDIEDGPAIFIANEWFDALPIRQYQRVEQGWAERVIGLNENRNLVMGIDTTRILPTHDDIATGTIRERAVIGETMMTKLAQFVTQHGGAFLALDYGPMQSGFGDTLQAVKQHQYVPVFDEPGEADLTCHVDFSALLRVAKKVGARYFGPVTQAEFLLALGLKHRMTRLLQGATEAQQTAVISAFDRLIARGPTGMGELFKVIAIAAPNGPEPSGFKRDPN